MAIKRRSVIDSIPSSHCYMDYDYELYTKDENLGFCHKYRCHLIALTTSLLALVIAFIVIFVIPPITFMLSVNVQRYLIFLTSYGNECKEFTNFKRYGMEGIRNLYVPVQPNITLGVWHILPLKYTYDAVTDEKFDYTDALKGTQYPILLYFHDSGENRITSANKYVILRRFFHVITFDYRSYGDSSAGDLLEKELITDSLFLYRWLLKQITNDVYMWGHGLGSSIAVKTITQLPKNVNQPKGLFLESAFTNLAEVLMHNSYLKIFSWTPWFEQTFLDPLKENDFVFNTDDHISYINCPIMIVHAEDNTLVPYTLGQKLVEIKRGENVQDNITFHLFSKQFRYGHNDLYLAPELPNYIGKHINICTEKS